MGNSSSAPGEASRQTPSAGLRGFAECGFEGKWKKDDGETTGRDAHLLAIIELGYTSSGPRDA